MFRLARLRLLKKGNKSSENKYLGKNRFGNYKKKVNAVVSSKDVANTAAESARPQLQYVQLVQSPLALATPAANTVETAPTTGKTNKSKGGKCCAPEQHWQSAEYAPKKR